ncbi:MAG: GTPase HflX [Lachnospiraceae bacterium]|jgi:GTP-binding protein HflX|nr:GTPase HflX [Lachnospiraceae bacterium]MEE3461280.1 GTPase HflX [Lachnospiraceae bacterium]
MYETKEEPERVILFGVETPGTDMAASLHELKKLAETAGAETVGTLIQALPAPKTGTYLGTGKIMELKGMVESLNADSCICDDELSPAEIKNLSSELSVKVIDRTVLILDIFAQHAVTSEGKLQVELAQQTYRAAHLAGSYGRMSRLGGGIGTRGPGEQRLEVDRRIIRDRISSIKKQLESVEQDREIMRIKRQNSSIPIVAIVGYTNAGKSTLLNYLTDAGVLSEDKLFATLDPTTRKYVYEDGEQVLFTDTVGFVSKLPTSLIKAFGSTLKEAGYADLILHVVDSSREDMDQQIDTVYKTLNKLYINYDNLVTAFNKVDKLEERGEEKHLTDPFTSNTVRISAKTGAGIDKLLAMIKHMLDDRYADVDMVLPFSDASKVSFLKEKGRLTSIEYVPEGVHLIGQIPKEYEYMFK